MPTRFQQRVSALHMRARREVRRPSNTSRALPLSFANFASADWRPHAGLQGALHLLRLSARAGAACARCGTPGLAAGSVGGRTPAAVPWLGRTCARRGLKGRFLVPCKTRNREPCNSRNQYSEHKLDVDLFRIGFGGSRPRARPELTPALTDSPTCELKTRRASESVPRVCNPAM